MAKRKPAKHKTQKPRKIRTWWHPLLACVLRWQLGNYYQVNRDTMSLSFF